MGLYAECDICGKRESFESHNRPKGIFLYTLISAAITAGVADDQPKKNGISHFGICDKCFSRSKVKIHKFNEDCGKWVENFLSESKEEADMEKEYTIGEVKNG